MGWTPDQLSVRRVELLLSAPLTAARRKRFAALARLVGRTAHGDEHDDTLVGSEMAPADDGGWGLQFHIDDSDEDRKNPWLLGHFVFRLLRGRHQKPTPAMLRHRKAGHTTELVCNEMAKAFRATTLLTSVRLTGDLTQSVQFGGAILPTPMVDGHLMEPTNLEFSRVGPGPIEGPLTIRVKTSGGLAVEFMTEFRYPMRWSVAPWNEHTERVATMLSELQAAVG